MFTRDKCTAPPTSATTDAGVAGEGVLLSFIITAGLALLTSAIIIFHELRRRSEATILRKLLNSWSDQQIMTGIGIQSVGLAKIQTMIPYHFFLIWMLSVLSTATHLATLLALVNDFKRDWVLRWLRQFLMFVNFVLSCAFGIIVLMATLKNMANTLPVECALLLPSGKAPSNSGLSVVGTIAVIVGNATVFAVSTWYLHDRSQRWRKIVQTIGLLVLLGIFVGTVTKIVMISQAFGNPNVPLTGPNESEWSFGQLLPMLLLLLPLLSAIEIFRGEIKVPPPVPIPEDQSIPLTSSELK